MSKKSNSRELFVDTASRLFFTQGYHATGLNQIIKESDCPKGSLYYYFPSGKEELASECIEHTRVVVLEKLHQCFANTSNAVEALQVFIQGVGEEAVESQFEGFMPFSFWAAVETSCISMKLRTDSQAVFRDWQDLIAINLQKEGMVPVKSIEVASMVLSLLEGALILALTNRNEQPLMNAAKYVAYLIK